MDLKIDENNKDIDEEEIKKDIDYKEFILNNDLHNKSIEELQSLYPESIKNFFISFNNIPNAQINWDNNKQNIKNIYNEATKIFFSNILLSNKLKESFDQIEDLKNKIKNIEDSKYKINNIGNPDSNHIYRKRIRKKKSEIERLYKCTFDNCDKSYGSENSLNQHLKIKHKAEAINN